MAQKAFGKVACFRVRPRSRYTQLFQTISETQDSFDSLLSYDQNREPYKTYKTTFI